nr:LysM peptidoglycan-binding domain-containing C40 family peptidase [Lactiplantibacillus herbarum]
MKVNIKQVMLGTAALAGMLVTSQAVANADSMTVKAGDSVWAYSQKYHVSMDKIAEANNLSNPNLIIAGNSINIPGVKTGEKVSAKTTTTASASSTTSTSAATSTASQSTSVAASSTTSASSTSQAVSSSSVAAQSSSTSTASASSVTSSASTSSVASQATSSTATSSTSTTSQAAVSSTSTSQASSQSSTSQASSSTTTAQATAYTASASTTSTASTSTSYSSVIAAAETFIGTPYEQMDCSAFTQAAFAKVGRSIGRTTYAQATIGTHVSFSQAQAGDLIFWGSDSAPYHVGIYLGGGQYIASPTYGESVSIKQTAYYTPIIAIHM